MGSNLGSDSTNPQELICRLRAAAVCVHQGRVILVCHERPNHPGPYWVPPGGGVQAVETLEEAALRELREETGYVGEVAGVLGFRQVFKAAGAVFEVFFHVRLPPEVAEMSLHGVPTKGITGVRWFSANELQGLCVYPEAVAEWISNPEKHSSPADRLIMPPVVIRGTSDHGP